MVFRLAGEIIAFLYRLFRPRLKRGFVHQSEVFVAATIRAISADFVWKFAATVVSEGSSLCPDVRGSAGLKQKWRRDVLPRDPAPHVRGRYQPGIWHETCHEENQGSNS